MGRNEKNTRNRIGLIGKREKNNGKEKTEQKVKDEKTGKCFLSDRKRAGERKNVKNQRKRRPHLTFQQVKLDYSFLWHFLGRKIFTQGKQCKPLWGRMAMAMGEPFVTTKSRLAGKTWLLT